MLHSSAHIRELTPNKPDRANRGFAFQFGFLAHKVLGLAGRSSGAFGFILLRCHRTTRNQRRGRGRARGSGSTPEAPVPAESIRFPCTQDRRRLDTGQPNNRLHANRRGPSQFGCRWRCSRLGLFSRRSVSRSVRPPSSLVLHRLFPPRTRSKIHHGLKVHGIVELHRDC